MFACPFRTSWCWLPIHFYLSICFALVVGVYLSILSSDLCVTLGLSKVAIEKVLLNIDVKILESPNKLDGC